MTCSGGEDCEWHTLIWKLSTYRESEARVAGKGDQDATVDSENYGSDQRKHQFLKGSRGPACKGKGEGIVRDKRCPSQTGVDRRINRNRKSSRECKFLKG